MNQRITGLVAATFTPMKADGGLDLDRVGPVVDHLIADGVAGLFVCGSTGEGLSLASDERQSVAAAYSEAAADRLPVLVHVGHNSLTEARRLAAHAQEIGAAGIAMAPPSYFKPATTDAVVGCLAEVAAAAPELPLYYYHIPSLTGVEVDLFELFSRGADALPTLAGMKFTHVATHELHACTQIDDGRFNILFGVDEMLLSALAMGVDGAVGSTYNLAAPLYRHLIQAFDRGDLATAREHQAHAVSMFRVVRRFGGIPAMKAVMAMIGYDVGPTRLPLVALDRTQAKSLQQDLEALGFFDWGRRLVED